jgi:hypothetical protein
MKFSEFLFEFLKRVAKLEYAHASTSISDDGVFEVELLAIDGTNIGSIAKITENASDIEITQFDLKFESLKSAVLAQKEEDAQNEIKIREVLSRLTAEERLLIERPLPEDLPPEDPDFCEYL